MERGFFIGKGNIVEGQKITGVDNHGNLVEISECTISSIHADSVNHPYAEASIRLDSLRVKFDYPTTEKPKTRLDWYVCDELKFHLSGQTLRNPNLDNKKIRLGIDSFEDAIKNLIGSSLSKDYSIISYEDMQFIFSRVPQDLLPLNLQGICLEFRENLENVDTDFLAGIKDLISFLIGSPITHTGYSIIENQRLVETCCYSHKVKPSLAMPPVKFNTKYKWGDFSFLLNKYLTEYLKKRKLLSLDSALSSYWIAREIPLGSNLSVLASALETIAAKYLKKSEDDGSTYLTKEQYIKLIEEEFEVLKQKLSVISGGEKILNKISGAYRKGPNEKMNNFFAQIGLNIGKEEKKAINLRNKMAHGSRDYSKEENIHNDLILTRVYEVLFHRTILMLIGYDEYYIDYSMKGCPSKKISLSAGNNDTAI